MSRLNDTLRDAFHGGALRRRELRLSREEVRCLRSAFPHFQITPLPGPVRDRGWYAVCLTEPGAGSRAVSPRGTAE